MNTYLTARKYAEALFGISENPSEHFVELSEISQSWKQLADFVPMYLPDEIKNERFNQFDFSREATELLVILSKSGKMRLLSKITEHFEELLLGQQHKIKLKISSAKKLTQPQVDTLCTLIQGKTSKEVICELEQDVSLIGGIKLEYDYKVIDDTIAFKLSKLEKQLNAEMEGSL